MVSKYKGLLFFMSLNYIDKAIVFFLPLFILFFIKDITLYNNIEYIYSVANIMVVLAELGGRSYMLYAYTKEPEERRGQFLESVKGYFYLLVLFYIILLIITIGSRSLALMTVFVPFIGVRILVLLFTNYFSIYYRLIDKPQYILFYSILINVSTVIVIIIWNKLSLGVIDLNIYFFIQSIFVLFLLFKSISSYKLLSPKFAFNYFKESIIYSWPIILNILLVTFVNNYGKIYIYDNLSEEEMYTFSYLLRISMVVQMAHSSIVAFYSKRLFLDKSSKIDMRLYKFYSIFLFVSSVLSFFVIILINFTHIMKPIKIDATIFLLLAYIFIWCQQAFFEQYLNKTNRNRWILYTSCISAALYLSMMFFPLVNMTIQYISFSMLFSTFTAFFILFLYLKNKKMI